MNSHQKPNIMSDKFYKDLIYIADKKTFNIFDFVMIPIAAKEIYEDDKFGIFKNKIEYIDFPTFISSN